MNIPKIIKITTASLLGTILIVTIGVFLFTLYVNNMSQASLISYAENYIENQTSQKTNIDKIDVHLSNRLTINIENINVGHASWAKSDHFFKASLVALDVNPFVLLFGKYDIKELTLKNANIAFERHDEFGWGIRKKEFGTAYDGEIDDDIEENLEREAYGAEMEADERDIKLDLAVLIGKLDIENTKITSYDHHFQNGHRLDINNITLREDSGNMTLARLNADMVANDLPMTIKGSILNVNSDMLGSNIDFPIDLDINIGDTNITINGVINDVIGKAEKNIKFALNSPNISQKGNIIGRKIDNIGALTMNANIGGDINNILINDIVVSLEKPQSHNIQMTGSSQISEGVANIILQTSADIKNAIDVSNALYQISYMPIFGNLPKLTNIATEYRIDAIIDPRGLLFDIIDLKLNIDDDKVKLNANGNINQISEGRDINLNIEQLSTDSLANLNLYSGNDMFKDVPLSFKGRIVGQTSKALLIDVADMRIGNENFNGSIAGKINQGNFILDTDPNGTNINVIELLSAMTK